MDNSTARVDWGAEVLYELYDLQGDTGSDFDFDGCAAHMTSISCPSELRLPFLFVAATRRTWRRCRQTRSSLGRRARRWRRLCRAGTEWARVPCVCERENSMFNNLLGVLPLAVQFDEIFSPAAPDQP